MRSIAGFSSIAMVALASCVIPPPLRVEVPESEYAANCDCVVCTDVDMNGVCTATRTIPMQLTECDDTPSQVDEAALEIRFREVCERSEAPNIQCDLTVNDPGDADGSEYVVLLHEQSCPTNTTEPLRQAGLAPRELSRATVTSGTVTMRSPDGEGTTSLGGYLLFAGGNCTTGSCSFQIVDMVLTGDDFSFAGERVRSPVLLNTTIGTGHFSPSGLSLFTVDAGTLEIVASGDVGGRRGLRTKSSDAGVGILTPGTHRMIFSQSFADGDVSIDIIVAADVDNVAPVVSLDQGVVVECNATGGANFQLTAHIADADGSQHTSRWYVDGALAAVDADTLSASLPLGTHTVAITVFDEHGAQAHAEATVLVQDTTPPVAAAEPACLWPPDHHRFVFETDSVEVFDVCDPAPVVVFTGGTSDQPDDGPGDGSTRNDIVVHPGSVCVRAERQGGDPDGRQYTVAIQARDAAGNASASQFLIRVPHHVSHGDRCEGAGCPVNEHDPRCVPPQSALRSVPKAAPSEATAEQGGCAAGGGAHGTFAVLVAGVILALRRRTRQR